MAFGPLQNAGIYRIVPLAFVTVNHSWTVVWDPVGPTLDRAVATEPFAVHAPEPGWMAPPDGLSFIVVEADQVKPMVRPLPDPPVVDWVDAGSDPVVNG